MKPVLLACVTYNRLHMVRQSLESWLETIPASLIDWWIVDNASTDGTSEWVQEFALNHPHVHAILLSRNLGTAMALNLAWAEASPGQHLGKADSDIVIHTPGFMERILASLSVLPDLGIVGLRRKDLIERPDHPDPFYRSQYLKLEFDNETILLELVSHVIGAFTIYNSRAIPRFGYLYQLQDERWPDPAYGYDDALACFRMSALGFRCGFLRGWDDVEVDIDHIDPGETPDDEWNSEYTRWKRQEAAKWMPRYRELARQYLAGERDPHYDARWDFETAASFIREVVY